MRDGRIYLDNAATSFPKPPGVIEAMVAYARDLGVPARGGYAEVKETARLVDLCRQRVCRFIGGEKPEHVVFTLNTTDAMNMAIHGVLRHALRTSRQPIHVITSELDHNSALRPLNAFIESCGGRVMQTGVPFDPTTGRIDPADIERAMRPETVMVVTLHASNVTGAIQPVAEIGRLCRKRGVLFVLDAAQSLGHVPVDVVAMNVDLLAFPGHKGLLGPTGTGGLYVRPGIEERMDTIREGGTGQRSEQQAMPTSLPDRFEPGSHNTIGIIGLSEGVRWLGERGHQRLREHEIELSRAMIEGLAACEPMGLRLLGSQNVEDRVGVFSFTHDLISPVEFGAMLEREHGILSRSGLHCAPLAHQALDTGTLGATRLSVGAFSTMDDVAAATRAVRSICERALSLSK